MKCSESWLREWVNPNLTLAEIGNRLTMGGLEVEGTTPAADNFKSIIVGKIIEANQLPGSNHLSVCQVLVSEKNKSLQIVCGASNVKAGIKVAVATADSILPNNTIIKPTSIQGVTSEGMLCSGSELGLTEESKEILELPQDAPIGKELWNYLQLNDDIIEISITPNRGDCLSVRGLAREVSALTNVPLKEIPIAKIKPTINEKFPIQIKSKADCPRYVGRIIRGVKVDSMTPIWLIERLRRSGIRSINSIVDVANYVMLELGQPMHAFDLNTLQQEIVVRQSHQGEQILLLDGCTRILNQETLIIADSKKPLAIAGVMGGLDSSVTLMTQDIFLESAYFSAGVIAKQRQYYGLNSDSAYRFERGVDPTIQKQAIERATQLILEIAGGKPGPILEEVSEENIPSSVVVKLPKERIFDVLGTTIPDDKIDNIFDRLHFSRKKHQLAIHKKNEWEVEIPPFRFDIFLPEDLIEEIARLYGYEKIPTHQIKATLEAKPPSINNHHLRQALSDRAYNEIISYSFIDKKLQNLLDPLEIPYELVNPITADMTVMRTNLWPGLINTLIYNKSRQQHRLRLFELGTVFTTRNDEIIQSPKLGGLITGLVYKEQWGIASRDADFYDLKGDVEDILSLYGKHPLVFKPETHPALHPGQSAAIYQNDQKLGIIGGLHPIILQTLDLNDKVFVFEIDLNHLQESNLQQFNEISKYPEIRRDIAILVNQAIPVKEIQDTIKLVAGDWLKEVFIFDVYQGKGITPGLKSIALALILQHPTRTLVDDEVVELMGRILTVLKGQLGAELRS